LQPGLFGSQERVVEHGPERSAWFGSVDEGVVDTPAVHITYDCCEPGNVETWKLSRLCLRMEVIHQPRRPSPHHEGEILFIVPVEVVGELSEPDLRRGRAKRLRNLVPPGRIGGDQPRPDHPW